MYSAIVVLIVIIIYGMLLGYLLLLFYQSRKLDSRGTVRVIFGDLSVVFRLCYSGFSFTVVCLLSGCGLLLLMCRLSFMVIWVFFSY